MRKVLGSLIAIVLAITLSAFSSNNNVDTKTLKRNDTVTYNLRIKSQPISAISISNDLQNQIKRSFNLLDSVNRKKLGTIDDIDKSYTIINPNITEKVIGYFGYSEENIIAKARGDTIIKSIVFWIILFLFLIHLWYLNRTSTINKEYEWKSSLIHFIIMIGSYPLIYYCLYYLLSGVFNSDYLTIKEILQTFK